MKSMLLNLYQKISKNLKSFMTVRRVAVLFLLAAILLVILGYLNRKGQIIGFVPDWFISDFYANISTDLLSIAITVLIIDVLNQQRLEEQEKSSILLQLGSRNNSTALDALQIIRTRGWHADGSMKGINLYRANLEKAFLNNTNLAGANFEQANLKQAYLSYLDLTGAKNLERAQLAQARYLIKTKLPDGRLHDGRYNLFNQDLKWAVTGEHIDITDLNQLADFYGVTIEEYLRGQAWAKENHEKILDEITRLEEWQAKIFPIAYGFNTSIAGNTTNEQSKSSASPLYSIIISALLGVALGIGGMYVCKYRRNRRRR
jgi:hypothetical protein